MSQHYKFWPALIVPSPALIIHFLVKRFPNKVASKVLNKFPINPPFSLFLSSFSFALLASFLNKPDSSRDLPILMIPFVFSFEIFSVAIPSPNVFLLTAASIAVVSVVNRNSIKTFLANDLVTFLIKVI